jgi:hypothetical protein
MKKESDGNGGVVSPWSVSFFLSFFARRNLEFPAKIKKGGGKDPPEPLLESPIMKSHISHYNFIFLCNVKMVWLGSVFITL